jgi:hypothetical protein
MTCPSAEQLGRYATGALDEPARLEIEVHVDDCDDCRRTISLLRKTGGTLRYPEVAGKPPVDELGATAAAPVSDTGATVPDPASAPIRPSQRDRLPAGSTLGRYEIGNVLGAGGMGIVYAARDPALDRQVAIKILRADFARRDPDATRRIMHEARVMAMISDPNVLNVFDVGDVDGQVYIAMELASGGTLRSWLDQGAHSLGEILEVFVAAGRGLFAAHNAGVVHRDFKPENVLIGTDGRVRVTDFGLAHDYVKSADASLPIAGTPSYMAPEQFEGGSVDARTDQFAFCVALYEALYGVRPFAGKTMEALADSVTGGRIQPPPTKHAVPASIRAILLRGLARTPGERFPTLSDLLKALGRDRARHPRQLAIGAAIALLAVAVSFGADFVLRDRIQAVTRTSFRATRAQVDKLVAMRTESFVVQSNLLDNLPALKTVAATVDDADFGLADPGDDRARLERIHQNLRSASWMRIARARPGYELAIADAKGRLLYGSAAPSQWGESVTGVPAIAAAYEATAETSIAVIRPGDPAVASSRLLVDRGPGLYVVFARVKLENDQPRLLFVQLVPSADLMQEVKAGDETQLSIVAPDGTLEGAVPDNVGRAATEELGEVVVDGDHWLVQRSQLGVPGQRAGVAHVVLARRFDVGLAGLFPAARLVLAVLALLLASTVAGALWLARQRDLTRRRPQPIADGPPARTPTTVRP